MLSFALLVIRLALAIFSAYVAIPLTQIFLPFYVPSLVVVMLTTAYAFQLDFDDNTSSECDHLKRELALAREQMDTIEVILQGYGWLISEGTNAYGESFTHLQKAQKDHEKLFEGYQEQSHEQTGSIINILEDHTKAIAENRTVANEHTGSICDIVRKIGEVIADDRKIAQEHKTATNETLRMHGEAIVENRKLADEEKAYTRETLNSFKELIEGNIKITQGYGARIDKIMADHITLVAENRKALDGQIMLIAANRKLTLAHETSVSKILEDHARLIAAAQKLAEETRKLAQEHEKLIKEPELGLASRKMVENVQKFAHTFRDRHDEKIEAIYTKLEGMEQKASLLKGEQNSMKAELLGKAEVDGLKQWFETEVGMLKTTLTAEARNAEEVQQLRQDLEGIRKLTEEAGQIKMHYQQGQSQEILTLREEIKQLRGAAFPQPMDAEAFTTAATETVDTDIDSNNTMRTNITNVTNTTKPTNITTPADTTSLTSLAKCADGDDASHQGESFFELRATAPDDGAGGAPLEPVNSATFHPGAGTQSIGGNNNINNTETQDSTASRSSLAPQSGSSALGATGRETGMPADDDHNNEEDAGQGRLLGDFLGRKLAREEWAEKKKPRRKTRKMYAIQAKQRTEGQRE
ncbi:hypothetical protein J7T55_010578 [Diaporthe amygdali]|uniref:uncharacterized protein n=1 Tax=Phomopsis amygdali TaxID=1214568 RepID=UPI0022FE6F72|nr:uncharacterized protein J7T55_010578 [Diaporthe amygdali]KAJ0115755.1 hypothetical protein J7T55_010578 [Diaporthe amygdali]